LLILNRIMSHIARGVLETESAMAFITRRFANAGKPLPSGRLFMPKAPGAVKSPQIPGEVPDRSSIPEEGVLPVPGPSGEIRRPLTQYGTAEEIMGVYDKEGFEETDPLRFEQSPPSYEEQRKAFASALRTPLRPQPGYALAAGTRMPNSRLAALQAESEANTPFDPGQ
jgi:hypothetical protein